jgi:hypothetical protein
MAVELKIRWDGQAPGLAEHRLSVGAFGEALPLLLAALRRIATQIVRVAVEGEAPQTGRFANLARQIDIEIVGVEGNSTGVNALVSFQDSGLEAGAAFLDLPSRSAQELLDAIGRESNNKPANVAVRKYLRALPDGVHKQVYELYEGGTMSKHIEIGDVRIAELPEALPVLREYEGVVVGVGFEPGKNEVRIKTDTNTVNLISPPEAVDHAIDYRNEKVRAISVQDEKRARLISLNKASDPKFQFSPEDIEKHIFKRWNSLLAQLAK